MDDNKVSEQASMEDEELRLLAAKVRLVLDIKDRTYGFPSKTYPKCFVGSEAVACLIGEGVAGDEADALRIGNLMLSAGLFQHVLGEHEFKNEALFYRFAEDEDHGKVARKPGGSAISWADFMPSLTAGEGASLQADIPERDPDLAQFAQDDLEAIGIAPLDKHNVTLLDCTHPKAWIDPQAKAKYNLVVIGAGSGGLVSSAGAAGLGAHVALIESHLLGGDCLNVGCVPSKALLRAAKVAATTRHAGKFGVDIEGEPSVDFGRVMERMRRLRAQIAPHDSAERFAKLGVDVFMGHGRFTGPDSVEVNGQTLRFSKAVVATGGTAAVPPIPGLSEVPYLTNASIFNLTELPARLGVIGAGPIGMELAQAFQRFGAQVTVFSRGDHILPTEDPQAAQVVAQEMADDGVRFEYNVRYERVESDGEEGPIRVVVAGESGERALEFDALLVAAGRKPNVNGLGLKEAQVAFDERQGVAVNDRLQTSNPNVYAVGDVASRYQFTHMADFMARIVIRNALFFGRDKVSSLLVPWATYTDPEVAHVGLYPNDLEARGIEYQSFERAFAEVDRTIVDEATDGFVKIHVKKGSDQILGATIVGAHAGDMISEISVAMRAGMGLGQLASVIHPYPTAAEAIRQCGDAYNRARLTPTVKKLFARLMSLQR